MHALVLRNFVSPAEQAHLRDAACNYHLRGLLQANTSGPHRYRLKIHQSEYCDDMMQALGQRVAGTLGFDGARVDPYLGWIISLIEPGGFIKPHIDRHEHYQQSDDRHLRCNVLVQGDDESAYPIIANRRYRVRERGLWAFFASEHPHGTQVIEGTQPRIVYQFGFTVPATFTLAGAQQRVQRPVARA